MYVNMVVWRIHVAHVAHNPFCGLIILTIDSDYISIERLITPYLIE